MKKDYDEALLSFIKDHPTNFHVVRGQAELLETAGYKRLCEAGEWQLKAGGKYYVTRNGSALIAFRIPSNDCKGFRICASHSDSPCLKIKENPEINAEGAYTKLNVELYGSTLLAAWLDRPLGVAGRLIVRDGDGFRSVLVNSDEDLVLIPNLAIHMNREVNKGYEYHVQKDLLPLYGKEDAPSLLELMAGKAGIKKEDILGSDLFCYNREAPAVWGAQKEFISSPRLDDVQCAFSSLNGFLEASGENNIPVHVVYDNEEVGSSTRQGAASTFLKDTLARILESMGLAGSDYCRKIAASFMFSADNAHAVHPNYGEKCDPVNRPVPGEGVVLKFSANQKYTTDGISAAKTRILAEKAGVPLQVFVNHSDVAGGSTLGNISGNQVPISTADIGIAQLAMHSPYETCGRGDTEKLINLIKALFEE